MSVEFGLLMDGISNRLWIPMDVIKLIQMFYSIYWDLIHRNIYLLQTKKQEVCNIVSDKVYDNIGLKFSNDISQALFRNSYHELVVNKSPLPKYFAELMYDDHEKGILGRSQTTTPNSLTRLGPSQRRLERP